MPSINPEILLWARETAGLTREEAASKLGLSTAHGRSADERLRALEEGTVEPTRPQLLKMAKQYRRPLLTFYMTAPPRKGDRGQDFRTLPADRPARAEALLDVLIRDIRARQSMVRALLEDLEEARSLPFVGSANMVQGTAAVLDSIRDTLGIDVENYRAQSSAEAAFSYLRGRAEAAGIYVLLTGNLGSHHTAIDVEAFRGFAIADPIAPFIVINDQDARAAWSFTLMHELAHLWLGATGVSGTAAEQRIERFCNDVAGEFLLPVAELQRLNVGLRTSHDDALVQITEFATARNVSRLMVAYRLFRDERISPALWDALRQTFREQWLADRTRRKRAEGGPNYYVVKRHRVGEALMSLVRRSLGERLLAPTKAAKVLGVKPRSVAPLLGSSPSGDFGRAA